MFRRCADRRNPLCLAFALMALISLGAPGVEALPDDRSQPIHISADKALRDEKQGVTIYSGNVQMNQGSMHIEGDTLTIYHIEAEADKIVAEGRPAKMRQRPDMEKGPVHARALVIEYYQREQKVHLQDEARVEQDGAIVTGDSIDYYIAQELVKADSDGAGEGNRVQVVIPPSMQQEINLTPDTPREPVTAAGRDPNSPATPTDPKTPPGQTPDLEEQDTAEASSARTESQ